MTPPAGRSGHLGLNCYFSEQVCGLRCILNHTSDFPAVFVLPGVTSQSAAAAVAAAVAAAAPHHQRRASSPSLLVPAVAWSAALSQHGRLSFLPPGVCVHLPAAPNRTRREVAPASGSQLQSSIPKREKLFKVSLL